MYAEDSFYTLSGAGRIGLVLLSVCLSAAVLWLTWHLTTGRKILVRLGLGVLLFAGFVWLSPQAYYAYYLLLFDGLPLQNVIKPPPSPAQLIGLLTFNGPQTLSAHSLGLLGWALFAISVLRPMAAAVPAPDDRA